MKLGSFNNSPGERGGGQVFSVLAFLSNDSSLNIDEVYNFSVKLQIFAFCVSYLPLDNGKHTLSISFFVKNTSAAFSAANL